MIYEIIWENDIAGHARVTKKGLYYEITCRDRVNTPHRIELCSGDKRTDLGICVPIENEYGFCTQIPVKRAGDGPFQFRLVAVQKQERYIPVEIEQPFPFVSRLKDAYLYRREGEVGIRIKSPTTDR